MSGRRRQLDVAHALTTHFGLGHFNAALHRSHHGVSGACTYRTGTRNLYWPENTRTEKAVTLRFERTVVDGFRLLTSPNDHERIMSGEARAILIASNSSVLVCAFRNFNKSFTDLLPSELAQSGAGVNPAPVTCLSENYSSSSSMLIPSERISFNSTLKDSGMPGSI